MWVHRVYGEKKKLSNEEREMGEVTISGKGTSAETLRPAVGEVVIARRV